MSSARQVIVSSRLCAIQKGNRCSVALPQPIVAPKGQDICCIVVDAHLPVSTTLNYYLICTTLGSMSQLPTKSGYEVPVKVLCAVPNTVSTGIEHYTNPSQSSLKLTNRIVSEFEVAILDELGKDVNFSGGDWALTIQFEFKDKIKLEGDFFLEHGETAAHPSWTPKLEPHDASGADAPP